MRIAVVGTGGVGGYFGGRLAQAEQDVVFLARGAHLRAIQQHGLQVESVDGDFAIRPAHATDDPAGIGPVGVLRSQVETRSLLERTMREVFMLACARSVCVADETVEKALALIDRSPEQPPLPCSVTSWWVVPQNWSRSWAWSCG